MLFCLIILSTSTVLRWGIYCQGSFLTIFGDYVVPGIKWGHAKQTSWPAYSVPGRIPNFQLYNEIPITSKVLTWLFDLGACPIMKHLHPLPQSLSTKQTLNMPSSWKSATYRDSSFSLVSHTPLHPNPPKLLPLPRSLLANSHHFQGTLHPSLTQNLPSLCFHPTTFPQFQANCISNCLLKQSEARIASILLRTVE